MRIHSVQTSTRYVVDSVASLKTLNHVLVLVGPRKFRLFRYVGKRPYRSHESSGYNPGVPQNQARSRRCITRALIDKREFSKPCKPFAGTVIDYRNWHLSLGRRFRSLKLWFVLRSFGAEGFRAHIRKVTGAYLQLSLEI